MIRGSVGTGARFSGQAAQTAKLMLYGLLAIVLMAMDHRGEYVPRVRNVIESLAEPVYHVVEWPFRAAGNLAGQFASRRALRSSTRVFNPFSLSSLSNSFRSLRS